MALARILVYDPDVLLLDEPFAAMDTNLREELQFELLRIFSHFEKDVVLVTHNLDEIYRLCDTLLVIDNGTVLKAGRTRDVFMDPELLQVAVLTGCKNISSAKKTGDHTVFASDWGTELVLHQKVGETITHVGIRPQDLVPVECAEANLIEVAFSQKAEDPFESNFIFACKGIGNEIWWKHPRQNGMAIPAKFTVDPANILQLRNS